ncbi:hypothetical protein GCM10022384_68350 [Streptomyces marokkonensis]|uniref:Uncharacterized protein n=1 Tax=Streptomyces marokkonensis TaxID=324855 RepID=A0ABP7SQE4_9ACTN
MIRPLPPSLLTTPPLESFRSDRTWRERESPSPQDGEGLREVERWTAPGGLPGNVRCRAPGWAQYQWLACQKVQASHGLP